MTASISLTVANVDPDDIQGVFEDTVRALRTIGEGVSGQMNFTSGADSTFVNANAVVDLEAADTDDTDDSPEVPEDDQPLTDDEPTEPTDT